MFSIRMLGLFMLIPVFTIYAHQFTHATPILVGIALGVYGLSQAILQIPLGMMSDRWGRKIIISLGLVLLILGSILGALTHSIYGIIIARLLQGMGAIGSVLIALLADTTPTHTRAKSMAIIGITIGLSFGLAMVLSPLITQRFGMPGIFYFTAILGCIGLVMMRASFITQATTDFVTKSKNHTNYLNYFTWKNLFLSVIRDNSLQKLNFGIFCQHLLLTSTFFALPILLKQPLQDGYIQASWHFYLGIMLLSLIIMLPCVHIAEKKKKTTQSFLFSVFITCICQALLINQNNFYLWGLSMLGYFTAFQYLEASLPAMISKQAQEYNKGTAMGVYSSCQFLGIFVGGVMAGCIDSMFGLKVIFVANATIAIIWLIVALPMRKNLEKIAKNYGNN